jgi:hypothetical protein
VPWPPPPAQPALTAATLRQNRSGGINRRQRARPDLMARFLLLEGSTRRSDMYSILYIIGAIVVIIVVLRLLGLY